MARRERGREGGREGGRREGGGREEGGGGEEGGGEEEGGGGEEGREREGEGEREGGKRVAQHVGMASVYVVCVTTPHMQQKETLLREEVGCGDVADTNLEYGCIAVQSAHAGMYMYM